MMQKNTRKNIRQYFIPALLLFLGICVVGLHALPVYATDTSIVGTEYLGASGLPNTSPIVIVARIIDIILGILGIVTTVLMFYAGFLWLTSAGNEDKIDQAKQTITAAIIGLVVVMSSYAISRFALRSVYQSTTGRQYPTSLIQFR